MNNIFYSFHVLVEKSAVDSDTPVPSINDRQSDNIIFQQLFDNDVSIRRTEKTYREENALPSTGATKCNLTV